MTPDRRTAASHRSPPISRDPAHPASPSLLRFDFVTVKAGRGRRRPAKPTPIARAADRFLAALAAAVPEAAPDLPSAITSLKAAADQRIMTKRRRARH